MRHKHRHEHRHKHKHKHKTTSISYGRTKANSKENSFCFVFVNLRGKLILCYYAHAYIASDYQALICTVEIENLHSNLDVKIIDF